MTAQDAVRFLHHEASYCRTRDEHEALCLLLPALLRALDLPPMEGFEARAFRQELKEAVINQPK
jgi:hypothetical protein